MATISDFTTKTSSDNRVKEIEVEEKEKIIFGQDCQYTIIEDEKSNVKTIMAIINQGGSVYKTKTNAVGGEITTTTTSGKTTITIPLTNEETSELGELPLLTNSIQIKYIFNDDTTEYGTLLELENITTLDN